MTFARKTAPRVRSYPTAIPLAQRRNAVYARMDVPAAPPQAKGAPVQNKAYMDAVRSLPCAHCGKGPRSEFCHSDEGKGMGIKSDCRDGWPGCLPVMTPSAPSACTTGRCAGRSKQRWPGRRARRSTHWACGHQHFLNFTKAISMRDDSRYILDDILCEWHRWATGWTGVAAHGACAMFAGFRSSRQWDGEDDLADSAIHSTRMKAVDFHVSELVPVHRTALQINARNLSTGRSVWSSARLPADVHERAVLLADARNTLVKRLQNAGVM